MLIADRRRRVIRTIHFGAPAIIIITAHRGKVSDAGEFKSAFKPLIIDRGARTEWEVLHVL